MRIHSTLVALTAAALVAAGCGGDSTGPKTLSAAGRYGLVSVDGATLPLTLFDDPTLKLTLREGSLTLDANNGFEQGITIDVVANGLAAPPEVVSCSGTYKRSGNTLTMIGTETENCSADTATATLSATTLTVSDQGSSLVFKR